MTNKALLQELKNTPIHLLAQKCLDYHEQNIQIPASIIKRLDEYKRVIQMQAFDESYHQFPIAGVDEAGRGPLAGSVYAAAVILPQNTIIEGLNDSKKLSEKKREELYDIITSTALAYSIVDVDSKTIDEINILESTFLAMNRAVSSLSISPSHVLIDGNRIKNMPIPCACVIGGDAYSQSIAAASVLAKVSRDRYIAALDEEFPMYGFVKHKGYGTKEHIEAIQKYGPCPLHRRTFIRKFI